VFFTHQVTRQQFKNKMFLNRLHSIGYLGQHDHVKELICCSEDSKVFLYIKEGLSNVSSWYDVRYKVVDVEHDGLAPGDVPGSYTLKNPKLVGVYTNEYSADLLENF
jgi:hypothetical protein